MKWCWTGVPNIVTGECIPTILTIAQSTSDLVVICKLIQLCFKYNFAAFFLQSQTTFSCTEFSSAYPGSGCGVISLNRNAELHLSSQLLWVIKGNIGVFTGQPRDKNPSTVSWVYPLVSQQDTPRRRPTYWYSTILAWQFHLINVTLKHYTQSKNISRYKFDYSCLKWSCQQFLKK